MGQLKAYYEEITELPEREWNFIASRFNRRAFSRGEVITREGETEKYLSFVQQGIVRSYIPHEEREVTLNFCFQNEFTSAFDSFLTQTPSHYAVQALTDTVVWSISYDDLQNVYRYTDVGNELGRFAAEKLFMAKSKRELSLLNQTAEERYLKLFEEQPDIIRYIPLKHIASYIGITPQALSRIRRRIS